MDQKQAAGSKKGGIVKRVIPAGIVVILLVAFFATGLHHHINFATLQANHADLAQFVQDNYVVSIVAYVCGYAILTGISFPAASLVTLLGGFLFGWFAGTIFTVIGATAGATMIFLIARTSLGEAMWEKVKPYAGRMEQGFRENQFSYLMFLRLLPVFPFWVVNLVPAFLGVKVRMYVLTTAIGILPGSAVYNIIGDGLSEVFAQGQEFSLENAVSTEIVVGLTGLAIISLVPIVVKRIRGRGSGQSQQSSGSE